MQLPKTTIQQRAGIYTDLRELLTPGFLAHPVTVNGVVFVLRSLDISDWYLLRYRAHGASEHGWRAWVVATATWMLNGSVVLNEEDALPLLYQMCFALPIRALENIYEAVMALVRRSRDCTQLIEAFLYEEESRNLWRSDGAALLASPGERMFLRARNPVLKLWTMHNQMEDLRGHNDYLWQMAKFQAGPHAPKGLKKINAQDRKRENDLEARRQQVMDRTYYVAKGMVDESPKDSRKSKRRFQDVVLAESPEELREEMRRWVAGEKDDHDRVIEGVKGRIREEVEGRRKKNKERQTALQKALEDEGMQSTNLVPLSGKAGQEFIERVKARVPGVSKVMQDNTHNSAYEKYIAKPTEAGALRVDDDGRVTSDLPTDENMLDVMRKPQGKDPVSLQQKIENRRPTATFLEDDED